MKHFKNIRFFAVLIAATAGILFIAKHSQADSGWKLYVSESQLFSVLVPGKPLEEVSKFRLSDGLILQTSEMTSFIDQRPYRDTIKNYVVKFDQTFGPAIDKDNRVRILERELNLYEQSYASKNMEVVDREIKKGSERSVATLSLLYDDEAHEKRQAFRAKIILNSTSKFHQIFTGPKKDLNSGITKQYFESLSVEAGVSQEAGNINKDWRRIESPFSLFAIKVPPITDSYFESEPSVSQDGKMERIGMTFNDPVWSQKVFYNVTGYQLEKEMSFDLAQNVLLDKHLKRHGRSLVGIDFRKDFTGETPYLEASYAINPPQAYPYLNTVRIRAMFLGNYMIVQELVSPKHLIETQFTDEFFNLIEFTPKKAFQKELQRHLMNAQ